MTPTHGTKISFGRIVIWVASVVFLVSAVHANERPTHFGISLAYPVKFPASFSAKRTLRIPSESIVPATLTVDSTGAVRQISGPVTADSLIQRLFSPILDSIQFKPGLADGHPSEQIIPLRFRYNVFTREISFQFPVDTAMTISDPDLYFQALELNGIDAPGIDYFPSYFYKVSPADTPGVCPYVVARIKLDSSGHLASIEAVNDGPSSFAPQVLAAANWGRYHAARVNGKSVATDAFLVVTFLPGIAYPTKPLYDGDNQLPDRVRVRVYPDTVGVMLKPMAVNPGYDGAYVVGDSDLRIFDTASVAIRVDTLGAVDFIMATGCSSRTYDAFAKMFTAMRFVPATDFAGRPLNWDGLLRIQYVDSTRIRIRYPWFYNASSD